MKTSSVSGKNWIIKKYNHETANYLKDNFNLSEIISRLLSIRNIKIEEVNLFLNPRIKNLLPNPFILKDMEKSVNRTIKAIISKEKIGIFGDYDVDGATSTALLGNYFNKLDQPSSIYIPDRKKEGYGPNPQGFNKLISEGSSVIFTVDCGTMSFDTINSLKNKIDVIVLDHHQSEIKLPKAFSVVNPNRLDDNSKLNYLCAAGVCYMFLIALNKKLRDLKWFEKNHIKEPNLMDFLDLVSLGTVCDVVPLVGLNRAFVSQGLKIINKISNPGLKILKNICGIETNLNTYHLGYVLGPRINAGGRVGKSSKGTELLISSDKNLNFVMARQLNEYNALRKKIELQVEKEAIRQVDDNANVLCVNSDNWHPGVIGIVASKLVEKFNKPSIVISENTDLCKASCRSVNDFDIGNLIIEAVEKKIIETGGGHKMAGGFSVKKDKITELKKFLKDKYNPKSSEYIKYYDYDLKLSSIDMNLFNEIQKISPFGIGNSTPKFLIRDCIIKFPRIVGEKHLSCIVSDIYKNEFKSIAFNAIDNSINNFIVSNIQEMFSLIVTLSKNTWLGQEKIELRIEDVINS